jgi:hypothetical protein
MDLAEAWCELVETGHGGRLVVKGRSMTPALRPGWTVAVQPVQPTCLRVGDVAVFFIKSKLVVHRIVLSLGFGPRRLLIEQGDATGRPHRLRDRAVLGRVVEVFDDQAQPVPLHRWRWSRGRRLRVSFAVFHRLAAANLLAGLAGLIRWVGIPFRRDPRASSPDRDEGSETT